MNIRKNIYSWLCFFFVSSLNDDKRSSVLFKKFKINWLIKKKRWQSNNKFDALYLLTKRSLNDPTHTHTHTKSLTRFATNWIKYLNTNILRTQPREQIFLCRTTTFISSFSLFFQILVFVFRIWPMNWWTRSTSTYTKYLKKKLP